jgi:hypothetical protein
MSCPQDRILGEFAGVRLSSSLASGDGEATPYEPHAGGTFVYTKYFVDIRINSYDA